MRLLLFSNSTNAGEEYLSYTIPYIQDFLKSKKVNGIFVPYAGISPGFDNYFRLVSEKLSGTGIRLESLHNAKSPKEALVKSELVIVGGGNTFCLLRSLQDYGLMDIMKKKIEEGTPYIGWSAGSNLACPTIKTTNDMPVAEPRNFNALNIIPFQINPHYTDFVPEGHAGETRDMRINEFLKINPDIAVAGLREGTLFRVDGPKLTLKGPKSCKIFNYGKDPYEVLPDENLDFLLQ